MAKEDSQDKPSKPPSAATHITTGNNLDVVMYTEDRQEKVGLQTWDGVFIPLPHPDSLLKVLDQATKDARKANEG